MAVNYAKRMLEQKNKYRGLVSKFRSKAFVQGRLVSPTMRFRSDLIELFLYARAALHSADFAEFCEWIAIQNEKQLPELSLSPVGYEELSGVSSVPIVPLETELQWLSERFRVDCKKISFFRSMVEKLEGFAFLNEAQSALDVLIAVESLLGVSLWSVQLRIALEQQAGGLERQKKYTADVRSIYKRGLLAFIAFNTSARNEERTTISKYRDDIKIKITRHKYYSEDVKNFMRYRLACEFPSAKEGLADILRIEQNHNIVDAYEGFISVAQEIVKNRNLNGLWSVLLKCLLRLSEIKDSRIVQMISQLSGDWKAGMLPSRRRDVSDRLFQGRLVAARRRALFNQGNGGAIDPWDVVYEGLSSRGKLLITSMNQRVGDIANLVGAVLCTRHGFLQNYHRILKLTINLRGLNAAAGLLELLLQLRQDDPEEGWRPWHISLYSPTCGVEDISPNIIKKNGYEVFSSGNLADSVTNSVWRGFHMEGVNPSEICSPGARIVAAMGFIRRRDFSKARVLLKGDNSILAPQVLYTQLLADSFHGEGRGSDVIALIAEESAVNDGCASILPVVRLIGHLQWPDYGAVENSLASAIALHQLLLANRSDVTASLLRFATGKALKKLGVKRPSELIDVNLNVTRPELIYFLREVCTPNVLDVARILKSSNEVMEERQAIFACLRILDPQNSSLYADEVMAISNQLALYEGQWLVDRTRLHVDTDAFSRWATEELAEDFARYHDLLGIEATDNASFDDILKEIETAVQSTTGPIHAQGEADAVLYALIRRAADEFINNPIFGLDFYLSKRIRHQSFIGLIRGPLEFSNIITTKKSETSEYHRNDYWLGKFSEVGELRLAFLDSLFKKFAAKFDETLLNAKEKRFHVRSMDKPEGLLYLDLPPHVLPIARTISRNDANISEFILTLTALLWAALETSLTNTRRYISSELKADVVRGIDEFRANARCVDDNSQFLSLDLEIGNCSTEVQRKLDEAAAWFSRADQAAHSRLFTLEQVVRVAIDSALRCQRAFEPTIHSDVGHKDQIMMASTLVFVHDVIFVALDNARAHSGLKSPEVYISVRPVVESGVLLVRVQSECRNQNRPALEKRLAEIRKMIDDRRFGPRTRKEGESGFFKLAAVVSQSEKGRVSFGFTKEGQFFLEVAYAMNIREMQPELEVA